MDPVLRQHIHKLIADSEDVKSVLELLENDHAIWARNREEKDLEKFSHRVKQLENDISLIMSDCFSFSQQKENRAPIEDFHLAFARVNDLFQDLKKVRLDFHEACIYPGELEQLEIDWGRFRKTIDQILKHLKRGQDFMIVNSGPSDDPGYRV